MKALAVSLYPLAVSIIPLERKASHCRAVRNKLASVQRQSNYLFTIRWNGPATVISKEIRVL